QLEVDFVIERNDGAIVAVEVEAAATVHDRDLVGLRRIAAATGDLFRMGVVLYSAGISFLSHTSVLLSVSHNNIRLICVSTKI
ncbi:MAG: hypothetical protein R6V48_01500, partial [Fidelibacterota bacterium]